MLGALASRTTGIYFLMLTLTYAVIGYYVFGQVTSISGFGGITGVNPPAFFDTHPVRLYYAVLVLSVVAYVGFRALRRTPFGLTLEGIRDDPVRMSSLGFNVPLHRTLAFALAGFVAGLAGVINIWWNGQIDPNSVNIGATLDLFIVAVIGGISHLEGAWLGAFVFVVANNYMRSLPLVDRIGITEARFNTVVGVLVLVIVVASPNGLMGLITGGPPAGCALALPSGRSNPTPVHNNHGGIHMNHKTARRGAVVASLAASWLTVGAGTVGATTVPAGERRADPARHPRRVRRGVRRLQRGRRRRRHAGDGQRRRSDIELDDDRTRRLHRRGRRRATDRGGRRRLRRRHGGPHHPGGAHARRAGRTPRSSSVRCRATRRSPSPTTPRTIPR